MEYDNSTQIIENLSSIYRSGIRNETIRIVQTLFTEKILNILDVCVFLEFCGFETDEIDTLYNIYGTTTNVLQSLIE